MSSRLLVRKYGGVLPHEWYGIDGCYRVDTDRENNKIAIGEWSETPPYRVILETLDGMEEMIDCVEEVISQYGFNISKIWDFNYKGNCIEHPTREEFFKWVSDLKAMEHNNG